MHVMFHYPRAWQVWRMAGYDGLFMHDVDVVNTFLELLQLGPVHSSSIFLAYLAYHIWLTRNVEEY